MSEQIQSKSPQDKLVVTQLSHAQFRARTVTYNFDTKEWLAEVRVYFSGSLVLVGNVTIKEDFAVKEEVAREAANRAVKGEWDNEPRTHAV